MHSLDTLLEEFEIFLDETPRAGNAGDGSSYQDIFNKNLKDFLAKAYTLGVEAGKQETLDWLNPSDTSKNERIGVFKVGAKWYKCAVSNDGGSFCSEVCAEKKKHIYPNRTSLKPQD